jgi:hypothetical protein
VAAIFSSYFSDTDGNALGIAITSLTGANNGVWQYSLDGGATWNNIQVALKTALLLTASDRVRFVPHPNYVGVVSFSAYAWDGADLRSPGSTVDLSNKNSLGGNTAFSTTLLTATCLINAAPVLNA